MQQEVSDDPNGRFAEGDFELIHQLESETNGVRACRKRAPRLLQWFEAALWIPRGEGRDTCRLEEQARHRASEAELGREVFRQYLAGSGAKATARHLNQRGLLYRSTSGLAIWC